MECCCPPPPLPPPRSGGTPCDLDDEKYMKVVDRVDRVVIYKSIAKVSETLGALPSGPEGARI